jgi:hypothetical protein
LKSPAQERGQKMELSPEEKKRIYEEEKVRLEAQEKIKEEVKTEDKKQSKLGCFILIVIIIIIALAIGGFKSCNKTVDLIPSVEFTGTKFVIININDFDWTNVELRVNGKYVIKTKRIKTYETYTVGAMQFTKVSDGTRFNPLLMKPQEFTIWCDTPEGRGYWYGKMK